MRKLASMGRVAVNGHTAGRTQRLDFGDVVTIQEAAVDESAGAVEVEVLYQDEEVLVIDKPAGHSLTRERSGGPARLLDALARALAGAPEGNPDDLPRPRLVHRLDKDTTGALILPRTPEAERFLSEQFAKRTTEKEYLAVVHGAVMDDEARIDLPIGGNPNAPTPRRIDRRSGKEALTFYTVIERYRAFSQLRVRIVTGRRHQIRVHLAAIGYPVVADRSYGGDYVHLEDVKSGYRRARPGRPAPLIDRPALHAARVGFRPKRGGPMVHVEAPVPADMVRLLDALRKHAPWTTE